MIRTVQLGKMCSTFIYFGPWHALVHTRPIVSGVVYAHSMHFLESNETFSFSTCKVWKVTFGMRQKRIRVRERGFSLSSCPKAVHDGSHRASGVIKCPAFLPLIPHLLYFVGINQQRRCLLQSFSWVVQYRLLYFFVNWCCFGWLAVPRARQPSHSLLIALPNWINILPSYSTFTIRFRFRFVLFILLSFAFNHPANWDLSWSLSAAVAAAAVANQPIYILKEQNHQQWRRRR